MEGEIPTDKLDWTWAEPRVKCATHGPMRYRVPQRWWTCVGFDGEDCEAYLTVEQVREILEVGKTDRHLKLPGYWQKGPAHFNYTVHVQFIDNTATQAEITMELAANLKEIS